MIVDLVSALPVILAVLFFQDGFSLTALTYSAWILLAVKVGGLTLVSVLTVNLLAYRTETLQGIRSVWARLRHR